MKASLSDGLIVRRATPADAEALVAFTADILRNQDAEVPDERTAAWTRDLVEGHHPRFDVTDFTVVEDAGNRRIVASLCLISQTWSYAGVPMEIGQVELVGTHIDYRGQGLIRRLMEAVHHRSSERGHLLQAIDGIPWFYRQFGYEMTLALRDELSIDAVRVPPLAAAHVEPFRVRAAEESDLQFITRTVAHGARRYLVTCCRDEILWRYELRGHDATSMYRGELRIIETPNGQPIGCLAHLARLLGTSLTTLVYELTPDVAWHNVTPSVLRYLRTTGAAYAARDRTDPPARLGFWLGGNHPLYTMIDALGRRDEGGYVWYLRVADLAGFLSCIAPVLEQRLAASGLAGYTGTLRIGFYREGVRLVFAEGRLAAATPWRQPLHLAGVERLEATTAERADALFPAFSFLQLLFGHRTLDDLQYAFPDCLVRHDAARGLLSTLFPTQASNVWAVL